MRIGALLVVGLTCFTSLGWAQTPSYLELDVVAEHFTVPWDLVWGPDNHVWCLEKTGRMTRTNPDSKEVETVYQIPDVYQSWDNSGAHSMILHPDFPSTPYIYVNYTYELYSGRLSRLTYSLDERAVVDTTVLIRKLPGNTSHNGSRLVAGPDGYLYLATGEAFVGHISQDLASLGGKVLRMDWDGNPAPDNPYGNYVYSMGHRNPQGLVFSSDGKLYLSEHGAGTDDEVNLILEGRNYGWPVVEGFCDQPHEEEPCAEIDVVEPLAAWSPTLAPCGLDYFDHPSIPEWQHSLLLVFLKKQQLKVLHLSDDGESVVQEDICFQEELGRLRDVLVAPNGRVFLATSNREINGWDYLAVETDDRILEVVNPDWNYDDAFAPRDLLEVFLEQVSETPREAGTVFPQPATESVSMFLGEDVESVDVRLYDLSGRLVWGVEGRAVLFPGLMHLSLEGRTSGMYVMEVLTNTGESFAQPLLIQRP